jgi:hypothetical protein
MRSKFRAKYINDTQFIEDLVTWRHYNLVLENSDIYRITAILKVETDIIASIAATSRGLAVMLVIIYVVNFITGAIVFIGDIWNVVDITLTDNVQYQSVLAHANYEWPNIFVDQGQFSGPDFIRGTQRENIQLPDNMLLFVLFVLLYWNYSKDA